MGTDHFMWSSSGNLAFECDHGILGDSPDRAGGTISSAFAGADGAFFGRVYQNLFLPAWYCSDSNGLYSSDRQLLYSPSVFLMSVSFGYTLSLLSFRYGLRGIVCMLAYLCPQYFIYIPLMILILKEVSSQMDRAFPASLRRSVVIFSIIILGCGLESYINPVILKIVLKNFF